MNIRDIFQSMEKIRNINHDLQEECCEVVYIPKDFSKLTTDELIESEIPVIFQLIGETLQDIMAAADEGDLVGKWWFRVFDRLSKAIDEVTPTTIVKELILGSTLERFRKHPTNEALVREVKVRFDRSCKLLQAVQYEFNKLAETTALVEEEMRNDFVLGKSMQAQTEQEQLVYNPELSAMKSKIQSLVEGTLVLMKYRRL